jgi:osmotically-inducible protein OsmY
LALAAGAAWVADNSSPTNSQQITSQVEQRLAAERSVDLSRQIKVSTSDEGVVTLDGLADSSLAEQRAVRDAQQTPGVTRVIDHLSIRQ